MRCDVNVSVRPRGQEAFGTKVEVKNMNSFSNMQKAIEFEIERQVGAAGGWGGGCVGVGGWGVECVATGRPAGRGRRG